MAKVPGPLPSGDTAVGQGGNVPMAQLYYVFLRLLLDALNDRITATTMITSSGAPTTADIPAGDTRVWKNTGAGTVRLYVNDGGSLKSALLS